MVVVMARNDDRMRTQPQRARLVRFALVLASVVALLFAAGFATTRVTVALSERAYPPVGAFVRAGGASTAAGVCL